jgi:hypothetical protein
VDKMLLPAVVRLSRSFWNDPRNGKGKEKRQFVLSQLTAMASRCRITTLELRSCGMTGLSAAWLAGGVLAQCRALVHLDLSGQGDGVRVCVFVCACVCVCVCVCVCTP